MAATTRIARCRTSRIATESSHDSESRERAGSTNFTEDWQSGARPSLWNAASRSGYRVTAEKEALPGAAATVLTIESWCRHAAGPVVVAIDGYGASGKTTCAGLLAGRLGASVVHTDDFFQQPRATSRDTKRHGVDLSTYYDWQRLRDEALEPLRDGRSISYRSYDWERRALSEDRLELSPSWVVLLEGVLSAAPQLADLVDRAVFISTPESERMRRLRARVAPQDWDEQWLRAERTYFELVRPPSSFDLVLSGTGPWGDLATRLAKR